MADIVLGVLDDQPKEKLRRRAARNQRSMNAELREIVRTAPTWPQGPNPTELRNLASEIRALSAGRTQTPSEVLIHEGRASRDAIYP